MGRKDANQMVPVTARKALDHGNETQTRVRGRERMGCAQLGVKASAREGGLLFNSYCWRWVATEQALSSCVDTNNHHPDTVYSEEEPRVSDALL